MPRRPKYDKKNTYEKIYSEYQKRIESHQKIITSLRKKCKSLRRSIKRQGQRNDLLHETNKFVKDFTGYSVCNIGGNTGRNKDLNLAKNLFYKYCLESGIQGGFIARFCGMKQTETVAKQRKIFTRSFATNKENKENYHRFLAYIKNRN